MKRQELTHEGNSENTAYKAERVRVRVRVYVSVCVSVMTVKLGTGCFTETGLEPSRWASAS